MRDVLVGRARALARVSATERDWREPSTSRQVEADSREQGKARSLSTDSLRASVLHDESTMTYDKRTDYVTRDSILKLLTDDEVATVSTAETDEKLSEGDEYVDLEQLAQGVQRARAIATPMGRVLPRKAVRENTWSKILMQLQVRRA